MANDYANVAVGDEYVVTRHLSEPRRVTVTRLTPTRIICDGEHFSRRTGAKIGSHSQWAGRGVLVRLTPDIARDLWRNAVIARLRREPWEAHSDEVLASVVAALPPV